MLDRIESFIARYMERLPHEKLSNKVQTLGAELQLRELPAPRMSMNRFMEFLWYPRQVNSVCLLACPLSILMARDLHRLECYKMRC